MKKSYIKYFIIVAVVLLFLYSIFLALNQKQSVTSGNGSNTSNSLSLPAQDGSSVPVKDFTKDPQQVLEGTDVIIQNDNYSIVYFTKDKSLLVTILSEPVQANRAMAEQEVISRLNVSKEDVCKLTIALTVPAGVNAGLAGQNYGLSFCSNGKPF